MAAGQFIFRIFGEDVSPETVRLHDLLTVCGGLNKAVVATENANWSLDDLVGEVADEVDPSGLFLIKISDGSDKLTFSARRRTIRAVETIARSISARDYSRIPPKARKGLLAIHECILSNGWEGCEFLGNGSRIPQARILADQDLFPARYTHQGITTLYGECIRTGGTSKRSATLRLLNGKVKNVRLATKSLAQELGHRLYQVVGLEGEATWNSETNDLMDFRARNINSFSDRDSPTAKKRSLRESMEGLSKAAGDRWNGVDPDEFVNQQRRG
jgi:hypothetical protein